MRQIDESPAEQEGADPASGESPLLQGRVTSHLLSRSVLYVAASEVKVKTGGGNAANIFLPGHTKAADAHIRPVRLLRDRDIRWPSVVLEIAWSETKNKLMADIAQWLYETRGDVGVVFTISIGVGK